MRLGIAALGAAAGLLLAGDAWSVDVPPEGACPPQAAEAGGRDAAGTGDVAPQPFQPGDRLGLDALPRLRDWLPPEVWERREIFFYEGMRLEIGPCYRRYPAPAFFRNATEEFAGRASLDGAGNLQGYAGRGLPFPPQRIADAAPDAGAKWAWNYRYRYAAAGFRGEFRILHVMQRGRKTDRYRGEIFWLPLHGLPGSDDGSSKRFAAGGRFRAPASARGIAWRQFRSAETDRDADRSDEIFVWVPEERRVRRAAPFSVEGLFVPSYTRGLPTVGGKLALPDASLSTPDPSIAVTQHWRRGWVGLLLQPNAYAFSLLRVQDVLAPINGNRFGYPADASRSHGPSGLSVASDRWDVRRAVVLEGRSRRSDAAAGRVNLWVDVLTQQPLYFVSRSTSGLIREVGIYVGRYSADDPLMPQWAGNAEAFGVILPVAQTFFVAGEGGWLRESYELRSDPPDAKERRRYTSVVPLRSSR